MEACEEVVRFGWSNLANPAMERHQEAWERVIKICIDYNIEPPTYAELISQNNFGMVSQKDLVDKIGSHASGFWWEDLVMIKGSHILNVNAGYFIFVGAEAEDLLGEHAC